nr:uncharacterized protein LOC124808667 [Hydra vulgaris]
MAKVQQLSKEEKACIQGLAKNGMSHADIATIYMVERTTIWHVVSSALSSARSIKIGQKRQKHQYWTQMVFSDDSMFHQFSDVKLIVRQPTSSNPTNPKYTCKTVKHLPSVMLLDWPGNSPDLNLIENLWMLIKKRISAKSYSSLDGLKNAIRHVWCTEITSGLCKNLAKTMPKRISAVLKNKGYPSKY